MSDENTIEGTGQDIDVPDREAPLPARIEQPAPSLAVAPQVEAAELVKRMNVIREAMTTAMVRDVDYGVIPGTDKPALLKPGAEKLSVLFQLDVQPQTVKTWGPGDHLTVECTAVVYHAPTGARLGKGEGMCSTREKKYGKRQQQRTCPDCGAATVFKSKPRPDGSGGKGWYCWSKKGGCGATFAEDDDPRIAGQETGEIDNPDLPDLWNTVVKMAEKRARIDAVLAVTGASALFTQDVEPDPSGGGDPAPAGQQRTRGSSDQDPATEAQRQAIKHGLNDHKPDAATLIAVLRNAGLDVDQAAVNDGSWITSVRKGHASKIIETFKSGVLPTGRSDIPSEVAA